MNEMKRNSTLDSSPSGTLFGRIDRLRVRMGASRGQFATFSLLLAVAGILMARPAGMLLWHRLRIITGMPRMAVANQDPVQVARAESIPDRLDPGRPIILDQMLVRDPFMAPLPESDRSSENLLAVNRERSDEPVVIDLDAASDRLIRAVSMIRLSGTAKGLGTALLDGAVRSVGDSVESGSLVFTLREVRSGSVLLESNEAVGQPGVLVLLDRSGARLIDSD